MEPKGSTLNSQELSTCFSEPLLSYFRALHAGKGTAAIVAINITIPYLSRGTGKEVT
jgi:hypothetical protein